MIRKLGGVAAGLVIAMIIIMTVESFANRQFNNDLSTDVSATVPPVQQPVELLLMVAAGWFLAALLGSALAVYISRARLVGWFIAAAILVGVAARFVIEAQPLWMLAVGPIAPLLGAWLGQFVVARRAAVDDR